LRSFHARHAVWQALQPMHLETSISLATSTVALRTCGGTSVEAERRRMSRDCMVAIVPSLPYATAGWAGAVVFFTSTRNALYSGVLTLASPTEGVMVLVP
jgi:hypothetical protein